MNALILAPFDSQALERLSSRVGVVYRSWTESRELFEPEKLVEIVRRDNIQIVVIEADFIFEEVFEETDKLKFIGVCRGSVNNVDIEAASRHGVLVVNTPGRNSLAVAELTLGLALSLARHLPEAHNTVMTGKWVDPVGPYISLRGMELYGKIAGIIGFGAIGREVAKRFQAFGMTVLVYDPYVEVSTITGTGAESVNLETLLREADFISLHCAVSEETRGLLGEEQFRLIKPAAYLINTAGWDLIDEKALFRALESRSIAGAAFDVFATHPLSANSPLIKMNNVILTPHIGGATGNTVVRQSRMIVDDIFRFLEGKKPVNLLNPEAWRSNEG